MAPAFFFLINIKLVKYFIHVEKSTWGKQSCNRHTNLALTRAQSESVPSAHTHTEKAVEIDDEEEIKEINEQTLKTPEKIKQIKNYLSAVT